MNNPETARPKRRSDSQLSKAMEDTPDTMQMAKLYWLSQFWQRAVFSPSYSADCNIGQKLFFTPQGDELIDQCCAAEGVLQSDARLALFGIFFWHDVFVDHQRTNPEELRALLTSDLLNDRVRFPFSWGRLLHDKIHDDPSYYAREHIDHGRAWALLNDTPCGIFQHGIFLSGPFGILETEVHRWIPIYPVISLYSRNGTKTERRQIPYETASVGVVYAFAWFSRMLQKRLGPVSAWSEVLQWKSSTQQSPANYADVSLLVADCILGSDRARLLTTLLQSSAAGMYRQLLKQSRIKGLANLPPVEIASKLNEYQQLQLLLAVPDEQLVLTIDTMVLSQEIDIPSSEVRSASRTPPTRGISFQSELSSLGIRPGHPKPFAALCSSILHAYDVTNYSNELQWRLGSDLDRGLQVSLTDYVRRCGPQEAIEKLILSSQPVTEQITKFLRIPLPELVARKDIAVSWILWKFGFEIPRHDDLLDRFKKRLHSFASLLEDVDWSKGETTRERIRGEGVNLFVSVEEFLDRLIAYNVWLLSSDHWQDTRFSFHLSTARAKVATILGSTVETSEGPSSWKTNGENALGTQLTYLSEFARWLETLSDRDSELRGDVDYRIQDDFGRPFPFRHTVLWADAERSELEKYKDLLQKFVKAIRSGDVAGVRNGLDHQRDPSRFPQEDQLETCAAKLLQAVKIAEQNRLYPVTFWFEEERDKVFGSTEFIFKSGQDARFSIFRPSTVSSLPNVTRIRPILIAPVNFLGLADGILHFSQMGESNYSKHWADYPRIRQPLSEDDNSLNMYEEISLPQVLCDAPSSPQCESQSDVSRDESESQ